MRSQEVPFTAGTTVAQVLPANPARQCLLISNNGTNNIFISFLAGSAVSGRGILVPPSTRPVVLDRWSHGDNLTAPVFASAATAATPGTFVEAFT